MPGPRLTCKSRPRDSNHAQHSAELDVMYDLLETRSDYGSQHHLPLGETRYVHLPNRKSPPLTLNLSPLRPLMIIVPHFRIVASFFAVSSLARRPRAVSFCSYSATPLPTTQPAANLAPQVVTKKPMANATGSQRNMP